MDMRLWRHDANDNQTSYETLLNYVCQTFEFIDNKQFRITFKDDDDTQTTITSQDDFEDALNFAQNANKKSLKLYIADCSQNEIQKSEQKEVENPIVSNIKSHAKKDQNEQKNDDNSQNETVPSPEQINAFLSDDVVIHLLSDLFVSVFEALHSSNFEVSFTECVQAIILSSDAKYDKITNNPIWPYFVNEVLAKKANFMVPFAMNMMKMNKNLNIDAIKQWIPTILNMLKQRAQNGKVLGFGQSNGFDQNFHNFGDNPWFKAKQVDVQADDDEIEQEMFEYTEELAAILNMGFTQIQKIKKLLNEHKGNKQRVVQELVATK